jgi:hypothetical protein
MAPDRAFSATAPAQGDDDRDDRAAVDAAVAGAGLEDRLEALARRVAAQRPQEHG